MATKDVTDRVMRSCEPPPTAAGNKVKQSQKEELEDGKKKGKKIERNQKIQSAARAQIMQLAIKEQQQQHRQPGLVALSAGREEGGAREAVYSSWGPGCARIHN